MAAGGWVEAFLEMMAVERAAARNTLAAYEKDLVDASGFLAGRGRDLTDAGLEDIEAYFLDLGARGLSPATAARRRASIASRSARAGAPTIHHAASMRRRRAGRCRTS
jgi:integrase/recombinase XerD